ncbi:MAG: hypothetical protein AB9907_13610 [Flexilinea sp.]
MNPISEISPRLKKTAGGIRLSSIQTLLLSSAIEGIIVVIFTFLRPSEAGSALFLGYSAARIILGLLTFSGVLVITAGYCKFRRDTNTTSPIIQKINSFFQQGDNVFFSLLFCAGGIFFSAWGILFSWLFIPANLRPLLIWVGIIFLQCLICILKDFSEKIRNEQFLHKYRLSPRWRDLSGKQQKILLFLLILSILYILVLLPSNINGTKNWETFGQYGGDEVVIYPILMDVMQTGETFNATLYHFFIYEDYHYGYPFYAWSAAVLFPVKILTGNSFPDQIQINLPLLRIFVSVLPVILACLIIVWLFTRFQSWFLSPAVFLFLLFAPGTLQNNQGFWHPDGLNLLFICLVLYFLQRDSYHFGRNFYLAAIFTGLSAATRLYGFFFVLAIIVYIGIGFFKKNLSIRIAIRRGLIYIILMITTILIADPFLFRADARERMLEIMQEKSGEMAEGYSGDFDPRNDYRPGWDAWYPAFEDHYTEMFCFFFLVFSVLFASLYGEYRLIHLVEFCWFMMIGGYLVFFVAVKSTQYALPVLLPLMGTIFSLPLALQSGMVPKCLQRKTVCTAAWMLSTGIFLSQFVINLVKISPRF